MSSVLDLCTGATFDVDGTVTGSEERIVAVRATATGHEVVSIATGTAGSAPMPACR